MTRHRTVPIFVPHAGCWQTCVFCNQHAISGRAQPPTPQDVRQTLATARDMLRHKGQCAQIAFFGGSFTAIDAAYRRELLSIAAQFLDGHTYTGIRVSTRPDAVDAATLRELKSSGVAAIELGAQSMDDAVLAAAGRGHTAAHTLDAARLIRANGFELGLQMMTGLPGDTAQGALQTAARLADLQPCTIRVYPALVLRGSPLQALYEAGRYLPQTLDQAVALCAELLEFFTARGVRVIRLGLQDDAALRTNLVAGPHHPALRELAEGHALLKRATDALRGRPPGEVTIAVAPGAKSKLIGQHRRNIAALQALGYRPAVATDGTLGYLELTVDSTRREHAP